MSRRGPQSALAWGVLAVLLLALLLGASTFDRSRWPGLVGDEATYLMAAQSLAFDFDYRYTRADYERFERTVGRAPDGLILQSPDGGATLVYGKPLFYPLFVAPFARLMPVRGHAIANALLLSLTVLLSLAALERRFAAATPLVVAALVFGSVLFAHVFWAHSDLFLACLVAIAYALVFGSMADDETSNGARPSTVSVALAGALLATVAVARPFYVPLLLPLGVLVLPGSRRRAVALAIAVAATFVLHVGTNQLLRGSWSSYSGERQGFYGYTGFPETEDGPDWQASVSERGSNSWTRTPLAQGFGARQTAWNAVYAIVGRHTGLVPYFFPLLLVLWGMHWQRLNVSILVAVALVAAAFMLVRPYNFYGGAGALGNRYLLPALPSLWFLSGSFVRWRYPLAIFGAALFMAPLWMAPRGYLLRDDRSYRYVSPAAERLLPYETTQSHLKPSGREDFMHGGLWVKSLGPRVTAVPPGATQAARIRVQPGAGGASVLVGSRRPVEALEVTTSDGSAAERRPRLRAKHRMWWSEEPVFLYRLDLGEEVEDKAAPTSVSFRVTEQGPP